MYGLIHRAMREMVIDTLGDPAWLAIEKEQDIGPGEMIGQSVYDDALTMRLLAAVSARFDKPMDQTMRVFGHYWVRFVSKGAYAAILNFTGNELATLLRNLDRMHQTVRVTMPDAVVPSFSVISESAQELCVEYRSQRSGLEPMVVGLLEGLVGHFGLAGTVEQLIHPEGPARFRINLA